MLDWLQTLLQHNVRWLSLVYVFMLFSFPLVLAYMWILVIRCLDKYVRERKRGIARASMGLHSISLLVAMVQVAFPLLIASSTYKAMLFINLAGFAGVVAARGKMIAFTIYSFLLLTIYWLNFGLHALT